MSGQVKRLFLADALRGALLARAPTLAPSEVPESAFRVTEAAFETADRQYREAVTAHVSAAAAYEILAATDAFRERVRTVREAASAEASQFVMGRADAEILSADPLDVVTPRAPNLSHVAAVRLADVSDRARAAVAALRASANARIEPVLTATSREALVAAKRARLTAFRGAVHAALVPFASRIGRYSDIVESLAALADGWY